MDAVEWENQTMPTSVSMGIEFMLVFGAQLLAYGLFELFSRNRALSQQKAALKMFRPTNGNSSKKLAMLDRDSDLS